MFVFGNLFIYLLLLVLCDQSLTIVSEDLMLELYSKYISAVSNENFTESTRRLLKRNIEYEIHVKKLKEVNGFKKHNLFVKESLRSGGRQSFIYINNPVESKTPKAYLTLEEFKSALSDRVLEQNNKFNVQRRKKWITLPYSNILKSHIYKTRTQEARYIAKKKGIVNIPGNNQIQSLKSNTDTIKYNEKVNKNENKINNNKVFNTDKTKITIKKVSATNNNVHKKLVTNTEKVSENDITLYLFTNITEDYTNVGTEIGVSTQDINLDTTEPVTKNTATEHTTSDMPSIIFEETILPTGITGTTDTSTLFENTSNFQTTSTTDTTDTSTVFENTSKFETTSTTDTTDTSTVFENTSKFETTSTTDTTDTSTVFENTSKFETTSTTDTTDTTDTSTVFEYTLEFQTTNTDILSNEENITNENIKMKEEPRRKERTKSFSIPTKKRRVPLGVSVQMILDFY